MRRTDGRERPGDRERGNEAHNVGRDEQAPNDEIAVPPRPRARTGGLRGPPVHILWPQIQVVNDIPSYRVPDLCTISLYVPIG